VDPVRSQCQQTPISIPTLRSRKCPDLFQGSFPQFQKTQTDLGPADHLQANRKHRGIHTLHSSSRAAQVLSLAAPRGHAYGGCGCVSIGGTEIAHFPTWQRQGWHAPRLYRPTTSNPALEFQTLISPPFDGEDFSRTTVIMPETMSILRRIEMFRCAQSFDPLRHKGCNGRSQSAEQMDFIGQSRSSFKHPQIWHQDAD